MSVGGIVLITICLSKALATLAQCCSCTYKNDFSIPDKSFGSFLNVDNPYLPFLNHYQNIQSKALQHTRLSPFPMQFHKISETSRAPDVTKLLNFELNQKKEGKEKPETKVMVQMLKKGPDFIKKTEKMSSKLSSETMEEMEKMKQVIKKKQYSVVEKTVEESPVIGMKKNVGAPITSALIKSRVMDTPSIEMKHKIESSPQKMTLFLPPKYVEMEKKIEQNQRLAKFSNSGEEKEQHNEHDKNIYYKFEYAVNNKKTKDIKNQQEERKGDVVRGQYSLQEEDGNVRTVKYYADWKTGFHAEVQNSKKKTFQ